MDSKHLNLTPPQLFSLKEQVEQALMRLIDDGELRPGDRLPSERELSEQLRVSRGTVREAVQFLRTLGLVDVRHASGHPELLRAGWRDWTARHATRVRELFEVRKGLEALGAELASIRQPPAGIAKMEAALQQIASAAEAGDVTALVQADVRFHQGLGEASGNTALLELVSVIGDQLVRERAAVLDMGSERAERSLEECSDILEAVRAGEPSLARTALIRHLDSVESSIEALLSERDKIR